MISKYIFWIIGVVILVAAGGGAYWYMGQGSTAPEPEAIATSTPQVQGQDITVGTGTQAIPGSIVSVLYVGMLEDGTVFDSSAANGNTPLTFQLGAAEYLAGFQIGINNMRVGGERRMLIPPELAYGTEAKTDATGKVVIPANSPLVFDVRLVGVRPGSTTPTTTN